MCSATSMPRPLMLLALLLTTACTPAPNPVQQAQGFWNALAAERVDEARAFVVEGDAKRQLRQLEDLAGLGAAVERLEVPAEAEAALLPTRIEGSRSSGDAAVLEAATVLRRTDDGWRVDLEETRRAYRRASADAAGQRLADALGRLEEGLGRSADEFGASLEALGRELGELMAEEGAARAEALEKELGTQLEALGDALAAGVEELERALEQAEAERREREERPQ